MEMLCRWFINDTSTASQDWRLKGHAAADFWAWVASWARAASMPSDLGGEDAGFILPPLTHELHVVDSDVSEDTGDLLFRIPDQSATSIHKEKKLTLHARCEMAATLADCDEPVIVWCERDDESALITSMIADAIEVKGSMPLEKKEAALEAFTAGQARVIVTKPKLAGFGLNWQHCAKQVFASVTYSYEQYYQAIRRSWRFGQKRPVKAHIVIADTERPIWTTVQRKAADHDRMKVAMASAMRAAQRDAEHVEAYTRAPKFEFPKWLEGQDAA
jgi:superfamily II DNA or RNA helicase